MFLALFYSIPSLIRRLGLSLNLIIYEGRGFWQILGGHSRTSQNKGRIVYGG